jgi:hypothetical protein
MAGSTDTPSALRVYATCIAGHDAAVRRRVGEALYRLVKISP